MNDKTKRLIDAYIERPFTSLLLIGSRTRGYDACVAYLQKRLLLDEHRNNMLYVEPLEDKALAVEQIRELKTSLMTRSSDKAHQVTRIACVIGFHTATAEAQNALLKLLEEPAEGTIIVLQSDDRSKVLPTILSRCHVVTMLPLSESQVVAMAQNAGLQVSEAKKLYLISNGDVDVVQAMIESGESSTEGIDRAKQFLKQSVFERLQRQKEFPQSQDLRTLIHDLIVLCSAGMRHGNAESVERWRDMLVELRVLQKLLDRNALVKGIFLRLCISV